MDAGNPNLIHVTGAESAASYTRGGASNRIIIYGFGDNVAGTHDTITVSGSWNAEINTEALTYREPISFSGTSTTTVTTTGSGSDVIFGGGNDIIAANTSGNNVIVAGLSTGKTGRAAPLRRCTGGSGDNIFIAGYVDCTLAPLATTGRLDYETLRAMDDAVGDWAAAAWPMPMDAAALVQRGEHAGCDPDRDGAGHDHPRHGQELVHRQGCRQSDQHADGGQPGLRQRLDGHPNYRQAIQ